MPRPRSDPSRCSGPSNAPIGGTILINTLVQESPDLALSGIFLLAAPFEHAGLYAKAIPKAVVRRLSGRDHQLNNDMSEVAADIRRIG